MNVTITRFPNVITPLCQMTAAFYLAGSRRLHISPLCTSGEMRGRERGRRVTITETFAKITIALGRSCAITRPPPSRNYPKSKQASGSHVSTLTSSLQLVLAHRHFLRRLCFDHLRTFSPICGTFSEYEAVPPPPPDARDTRHVIVVKLERIIALRLVRRYQCNARRRKITSITFVNQRYFARNSFDGDFLTITREAFYQRLSMVNSIKICRIEATASVRVRTARRTDWQFVDGQAWPS